MEPRIQYAKTADGLSIAYYVIGEGDPLVMMPSGPMSHLQIDWEVPRMRDLTEALAEGRSLVRYDRRGSGLSDENTDMPLSLETSVRDMEAVVDALSLDRFSILASAAAGPSAIAYASRDPERVSALIFWCSAARNADVVGGPSDRALGALRDSDWYLYTEVLGFINYGWKAGEAGAEYAARLRETTTPEKFRRNLTEMFRFDASEEAKNVQARTIVMMRAPTDRARPGGASGSRRLAATIPNAQLLILEGDWGPISSGNTGATIAAIRNFLGDAKPKQLAPESDTHTILFTDMEGSTTLADRLGDASAQEVRRTHNDIVRAALSAKGGNEIKHTGDGIMASFSTASSALDAAIAIQQGVAQHKGEHPDSPLAVYVGINAGEPIAEDDDLFGTSINLAARICDHAQAGQILAANVVRELAAGKDFLFSDLGETELRGFEDPVKLWELRWREGE